MIRGGNLLVDEGFIFSDTLGDRERLSTGIDIVVTGSLEVRAGGITTDVFGRAPGGVIQITAKSIIVGDEGIIGTRSLFETSGRAGTIALTAETMSIAGLINSETEGGGNAGAITMTAETLSFTSSSVSSDTSGNGNAGAITITANTFYLTDGGISNQTLRDGNAGAIRISADTISITGSGIDSSGGSFGSGNAGAIAITADALSLADSRLDSLTTGDGNAGVITITADVVSLRDSHINSNTFGSGDAGVITIHADTISLMGSDINIETSSSGRGGEVRVTARDTFTVEGFSQVSSTTGGSGDAGTVTIESRRMVLRDQGEITSATSGTGAAGNILITATDIVILTTGGRITAGTTGQGAGATIEMRAGAITINGRSSNDFTGITVESDGEGNAGNININVMQTLSIDQSEISTSASQADGGDVNIIANFIRLRDGQINTVVGSGDGGGGNITLDTQLGLLERSEIRADAFGGPGGNITIRADGFITDVDSVISASSQQSVDGTVSIQGLVDLSGSLAPLDPSFAAAAALQSDPCIGRLRGEGISRFALAGRDRLPTEPGGLMPSPSGMAAAMAPPARQAAARLSQGQPRLASTLTARHRDCVR